MHPLWTGNRFDQPDIYVGMLNPFLCQTRNQCFYKEIHQNAYRDIAAKLDDAYHSASFNVTYNSGPVCFMSHDISHEEVAKVQEWLLHEETKGDRAEEVKYFGHLADQWRTISGEHL